MTRKAATASPAPEAKPASSVPRITKKIPRSTEFEERAKAKAMAGTYRVITSNVFVPRPDSEWRDSEGKPIPGVPSLDVAEVGDEVYLGDADALRLTEQNVVEPLNALPSRAGQVFKPPHVVHNMNAGPGDKPQQYPGPQHGPRV